MKIFIRMEMGENIYVDGSGDTNSAERITKMMTITIEQLGEKRGKV